MITAHGLETRPAYTVGINRRNAIKGLDVILQHKLQNEPDTAFANLAVFAHHTAVDLYVDTFRKTYPQSQVVFRVLTLDK